MAGFGDIIGTDLTEPETKIVKQTIEHNGNVYIIDKIYGEGTFGRVSKCSKTKDDVCEYFAIKQMKIEGKVDARLKRAIEEFKHEYTLLEELKDKCNENPVLCIYDHFEKDGNYYLIMEDLFVKGYKECMDAVHENGELLLKIINKMCESMVLLHSIKKDGHSLAHRDIKLDNIMYKLDKDTNEVHVKFIDFGASCFECEMDLTGALMYSDPVMSSKIINLLINEFKTKTKTTIKFQTNCNKDFDFCYVGADYYNFGMCLIGLILKQEWYTLIPRFTEIIQNIATKYPGPQNQAYRVLYTDMFKKYFIDNFNAISKAIDQCHESDYENFYNITPENYPKKMKQIYNFLQDFHIKYGNSFAEMENKEIEKTMNNIIMENGKLYDIRNLIKHVLRVKEYFHKLDYDLNLFAYPMHRRYIRLKSSHKSPIKRSPRSPSKSPSHGSPSKKKIRVVGGQTKKNKSQKYRHRQKQNKRTKKNVHSK